MAGVFTQAGEEFLVDLIDGTASVPPDYYIGWGTGAGTADKSDTALFTEASEDRIAATLSQSSADKSRFVAKIVADGSKTITNAGVFTAADGGTLIIHWDHPGIALDAGWTITYTVDLEQG